MKPGVGKLSAPLVTGRRYQLAVRGAATILVIQATIPDSCVWYINYLTGEVQRQLTGLRYENK